MPSKLNINPYRRIKQLTEQLKRAQLDRGLLRDALRAERSRRRADRAEVARLQHRLRDFTGTAPAPGRLDALRPEMTRLRAEGRNNAQIARLLGCSRTAVSLLLRNKYPSTQPIPAKKRGRRIPPR